MLPGDGLPVDPAPASALAPVQAERTAGAFVFHADGVLGTRLNLVVRAAAQDSAYAAAGAVRAEIDRLDRVFNWRAADSEISRLNGSACFEASEDLFTVVVAAERWRALSGGACSGRLGLLREMWSGARDVAPDPVRLAELAAEIDAADVRLDPPQRVIVRPDVVRFDLDAIAKGYIIDRAVEAAMATPGVGGAMVDIGGDIRCAGEGPERGLWRVALPEPLTVFDNAPACGAFVGTDFAAATSGCGPRDAWVGGERMSATLDARDGRALSHRRSASVVAARAMEADAAATAALVTGTAAPELLARVTTPEGVQWRRPQRGTELVRWVEEEQGAGAVWPDGWIADVTFDAPPKDMRKERAFRSPYVAVWISDEKNTPVRTLLLVGTIKEWQENNFIWWGLNRAQAKSLLDGRSMSTRGSGTYRIYWDGIDDAGRQMPAGKYVLHLETSRERGGHAHRMLQLDLSVLKPLKAELPVDADTGSIRVEVRKF